MDNNVTEITEQDLIDYRTKCELNVQYPNNPDYDVEVYLRRLNIDKRAQKKIQMGQGFIIQSSSKLKNDTTGKNENSIFSPKFGKTLNDINNPMASDYRCDCGESTGHIYFGHICPKCLHKVEKKEVDFDKFGYIPTFEYPVIHPNLYRSIETYLSTKILTDILIPSQELDVNGNLKLKEKIKKNKHVSKTVKKKMLTETKASQDNPFVGIGMLGFYERFDEIMDYYYPKKQKAAKEIYQNIMEERDKVFCHYVPVYTTQLRPYSIKDNVFNTEGNNALFQIIAAHSNMLRNIRNRGLKNKKSINLILWNIQFNWNAIYTDNETALSGKKGDIRECMSARCNFSVRSIIVPDPKLEMDEVKLPYAACIELLRFHIINILRTSYNYNHAQAYYAWYTQKIAPSEWMKDLMMNIIKSQKWGGLPLWVNRNPTIQYGSILFMKCIGINMTYSMSVSPLCLRLKAADFDGDSENIILLLNDDIIMRSIISLDPVNAMVISKNDGMFNDDVNLQTEALITMNGIRSLADEYTEDEEALFEMCKATRPEED